MSTVITSTSDEQLLKNVQLLGTQIGRTPLHRISRLFNKPGVTIYAKKEWQQLAGSVKARAGYAIFKAAIENGSLTQQKALLDATSGNTGIAYATIGHRLQVPVTLCLPENASPERKEILQSLGADIIFTSRFEGTDGAQQVAKELADKSPDKYFYADQYKNDNNWKAHYNSTALEIFDALPGITHFIAGLGTTGTFTGTVRRLKALNPAIHCTSLQPDNPLHGLEGWKHLETAIVPGIYDSSLADDSLEVGTEEAWEMIKAAYHYENLLLSPSSAANLVGALRVAEKLDQGIVVTILPDNADKYKDIIKNLL
ncbi:cysteine synthase family protein [Niastella caeni]|uniref:Cysteine synthase family protein n=1 Tax=Niastella caeni TaxID=2569763 RepID=A0A4S8HYQ6_9BACT|nr:cysteine synthase family protein [Niastella caeni]THU40958.1 cysteine synthase family protein [Niastella caeni]